MKIKYKRNRLTPEQRSKVIVDFNDGYTAKELSIRYGVTTGAIYKILREEDEKEENEK